MAIAHLFPPFIIFSILFTLFQMASSVTDSEALLRLKKSFRNTESLNSWVPDSEPCNGENKWDGLICYSGIVIGLRLEDMGLSGKIDVEALLEMPGLRSVSFFNNSFSGPVPEFNRLGALKAIYLSINHFSGEISPDYFVKMSSLKKVWLSDNNFNGEIPLSLAKLPHLIELHIENNQFSGAIPMFEQSNLMSLNVSNNKLEGEIPVPLSKFNSSSFSGNVGLCGGILGKACGQVWNDQSTTNLGGDEQNRLVSESKTEKENTKIGASIMSFGVVLLSLMLVAIALMKRKQDKFDVLGENNLNENVEVNVSDSSTKGNNIESNRKGMGMGSSRKGSNANGKCDGSVGGGDLVIVNGQKGMFGLPDLMKAAAEVLGNGGLGSSYKAIISHGITVVVKRMRDMNKMGKEGFDAEIRKLGRLRHRNILPPLAYHYMEDEKLLVYDYIPKGSLLYLLHGERGPSHAELDWPARLKIVHEIAQGLGYLHTELVSSELPHGNLKSSNVLIGAGNQTLLSDYGYYPLINNHQASQALFAYKAPEAAQYRQISPKCDVYCLGIIILEVVTGKFPSQYLNNGKGGTDVVEWVVAAMAERRESELFDPEITASLGNGLVEIKRLMHIGAACTESNPERRLELREAIRMIEEVHIEGEVQLRANNKTMRFLPSLRDGYADLPSSSSSRSYFKEEYGELSGRKQDNFEDGLGHRIGNSFTFPVS